MVSNRLKFEVTSEVVRYVGLLVVCLVGCLGYLVGCVGDRVGSVVGLVCCLIGSKHSTRLRNLRPQMLKMKKQIKGGIW